MGLTILQRLVVAFTVSLIVFISYSSQIFIVWPWYGSEISVDLLLLLGPFNLLLAWLWANYWLCVLVDPGRVPVGWKPNAQDPNGYEIKKVTGMPRFCRTCQAYKPPRAHHCKTCDRCVLRMDHHCPWIGNCVGHRNYGHFIRFLISVVVCCTYHLTMVTMRVREGLQSHYFDAPSNTELVFIVLNYTASVPVVLAVGGFSMYHLNCLFTNTTTIEGWEKQKTATLVRKGRVQDIKFPYNLGWKRNIVAILGNSPLHWCCPTRATGDGVWFPVAGGDDAQEQAGSWPPRDPAEWAREHADETHQLVLPESPWTFENNSVNPYLQPHNSEDGSGARQRRRRKDRAQATYAVPPYHPDYDEAQVAPAGASVDDYDSSDSYSASSDDARYTDKPSSSHHPRVRRGSEGMEVRAINREAMLRDYVHQVVQEDGRYQYYEPEPSSDSEGDDDMPLSQLHLPVSEP